ncbi:MAG TPA: hypothetical protein H9732_10975 [Candidatus Mediterraneibacter avicola]|nr:hypothetical protein [Candidatus Mediterraneibacter avicola]
MSEMKRSGIELQGISRKAGGAQPVSEMKRSGIELQGISRKGGGRSPSHSSLIQPLYNADHRIQRHCHNTQQHDGHD